MHSDLRDNDTLKVVAKGGVVTEGKKPSDFVGYTYSTADAAKTGQRYAEIINDKVEVFNRDLSVSATKWNLRFTVDKHGKRVYAEGAKVRAGAGSGARAPKDAAPAKSSALKGALSLAQMQAAVKKVRGKRDEGSIKLVVHGQHFKSMSEPADTIVTLALGTPMAEARIEKHLNDWTGNVLSIREATDADVEAVQQRNRELSKSRTQSLGSPSKVQKAVSAASKSNAAVAKLGAAVKKGSARPKPATA